MLFKLCFEVSFHLNTLFLSVKSKFKYNSFNSVSEILLFGTEQKLEACEVVQYHYNQWLQRHFDKQLFSSSAKNDFRNDEVHKDFIQGPTMRARDLQL